MRKSLKKLQHWFRKIEKRDIIRPPLHKEAVKKIKMCEKLFEDFARRVYDHNQPKRLKEQNEIFEEVKEVKDS